MVLASRTVIVWTDEQATGLAARNCLFDAEDTSAQHRHSLIAQYFGRIHARPRRHDLDAVSVRGDARARKLGDVCSRVRNRRVKIVDFRWERLNKNSTADDVEILAAEKDSLYVSVKLSAKCALSL